MTDQAIYKVLGKEYTELVFLPDDYLPFHPNGMKFFALDDNNEVTDTYEVYSVGGGALVDEDGDIDAVPGSAAASEWNMYQLHTMNQMLEWTSKTGKSLHQSTTVYLQLLVTSGLSAYPHAFTPTHGYVYECEGEGIKDYLKMVWKTMSETIGRGIKTTGVLPGGLGVPRKAPMVNRKAQMKGKHMQRNALTFSYALAAMEENASGGVVVTAPTCGASGVVPATLKYLEGALDLNEDEMVDALATAGLLGNIIKTNASISGAEVGCQGEVGSATAMAAGAAAFLMGGSPHQIETAAEMGMEHFLGLTCDPVEGLVQIPCIERNAFGATRALDAAEYALMLDGRHRISFDEVRNLPVFKLDMVVLTMKLTGLDIEECYRETAKGGLSRTWNLDETLAEGGADMDDLLADLVEQKRLANAFRRMSTVSRQSEGPGTRTQRDSVSSTGSQLSRTYSEIQEKCKQPRIPVYC
ncbi:hypothetical protein SARC_07177 [Sphaeroforma arctica JP610]|uniref:L-serine ammonia-lyase n=1 Tax=Sphaeroforma arctica JP610 TaxID=667725 RepID=A0A0L0FV75_9EUKA|nr:hypothetical protein SARC_07177 [Sphaeroforma arctica JP610]KNC80461.1 hypothetical protein SARC_07177 [Sphaeroforma arctica JP610]|eukprot:XP_014154363.1 hypothetical protein SARC_07177 [Sphaeroforma arctica JP610]